MYGKESAYNTGDLGLISGSGRPPAEGNGYPLQHYYLVSDSCASISLPPLSYSLA